MGHIGLTPQSVHLLGGFKVQGKAEEDFTLCFLCYPGQQQYLNWQFPLGINEMTRLRVQCSQGVCK